MTHTVNFDGTKQPYWTTDSGKKRPDGMAYIRIFRSPDRSYRGTHFVIGLRPMCLQMGYPKNASNRPKLYTNINLLDNLGILVINISRTDYGDSTPIHKGKYSCQLYTQKHSALGWDLERLIHPLKAKCVCPFVRGNENTFLMFLPSVGPDDSMLHKMDVRNVEGLTQEAPSKFMLKITMEILEYDC